VAQFKLFDSMFSGIVEEVGEIIEISTSGSNIKFRVKSNLAQEASVDQSISHDGICLTVTEVHDDSYTVVAVNETISLTNLDSKKVGDRVNLERCVKVNDRLDGHIVQGHVDALGRCTKIENHDGSWMITFKYPPKDRNLLVSKGSITVNGVSLTVIAPSEDEFSIAIIPYTFEHTTFKYLTNGSRVNLEYDIIGKYLDRRMSQRGL